MHPFDFCQRTSREKADGSRLPGATRGSGGTMSDSEGARATAVEIPNRATVPRVCQEPTCTTVLSRYNSQAWCAVHAHGRWRPREPRSAITS
jgi:hypothetical protein